MRTTEAGDYIHYKSQDDGESDSIPVDSAGHSKRVVIAARITRISHARGQGERKGKRKGERKRERTGGIGRETEPVLAG